MSKGITSRPSGSDCTSVARASVCGERRRTLSTVPPPASAASFQRRRPRLPAAKNPLSGQISFAAPGS
jgi:hypothetical protein